VTATAGFRALVSAELEELERRLRDVGRGAHPTFAATAAHLFGSPGKMLRPTLVFLSSRFGPTFRDAKIVDLAESLELVHTASLVHDDIIDASLMRRNHPTVNAQWNDDVALIAGDYLFAKAYALAAVLPKPGVIALVAQTVFALCDGELNEIAGEPRVPTEREYLERIELKTASLYAACCQGAAMLADAEPEAIATLGAFGTSFGLAFQIADDVLDLAGDDETLGKHVGQDLERGMLTLPMIYALDELGASAGRRFLTPHKSPAETVELLKAVRATRGIERARERAAQFRDRALAALEDLPERPERDALAEITYFATERER
jgi:heptaprenyl diphosphate synthase